MNLVFYFFILSSLYSQGRIDGIAAIVGKNIILHCRGGKGRAGTAAAILLIEFGEDKMNAINIVRNKRKGAIESKTQEDFILSYRVAV